MLQFCHTQLPIRFSNRSLAMDPFGRAPIEPWALARQRTHDHAAAACLLDVPVVPLEPRTHGLADVPRRMVPDQPQGRVAFSCQPCRQPCETLGRHRPDWPPISKAEEQALGIRPSQPLTRNRLGRWVVPVRLVLEPAPGLIVCPGMEVGLGQPAPPDVILKAHTPFGMPPRQRDQTIAPLLFRAYGGSALVIQCLARFPGVRRRCTARHMVASLLYRAVTPCSWHTWTARASVQTPVGLPSVRGD
jgi:hypothetical protein